MRDRSVTYPWLEAFERKGPGFGLFQVAVHDWDGKKQSVEVGVHCTTLGKRGKLGLLREQKGTGYTNLVQHVDTSHPDSVTLTDRAHGMARAHTLVVPARRLLRLDLSFIPRRP